MGYHTAGYVPAKAKEVTGKLSFNFVVLSRLGAIFSKGCVDIGGNS
jgi:hypothetical protein